MMRTVITSIRKISLSARYCTVIPVENSTVGRVATMPATGGKPDGLYSSRYGECFVAELFVATTASHHTTSASCHNCHSIGSVHSFESRHEVDSVVPKQPLGQACFELGEPLIDWHPNHLRQTNDQMIVPGAKTGLGLGHCQL